jgi:hypothetical protein
VKQSQYGLKDTEVDYETLGRDILYKIVDKNATDLSKAQSGFSGILARRSISKAIDAYVKEVTNDYGLLNDEVKILKNSVTEWSKNINGNSSYADIDNLVYNRFKLSEEPTVQTPKQTIDTIVENAPKYEGDNKLEKQFFNANVETRTVKSSPKWYSGFAKAVATVATTAALTAVSMFGGATVAQEQHHEAQVLYTIDSGTITPATHRYIAYSSVASEQPTTQAPAQTAPAGSTSHAHRPVQHQTPKSSVHVDQTRFGEVASFPIYMIGNDAKVQSDAMYELPAPALRSSGYRL